MFRKLYIIGNGFDIHHGLKTGYADFHKWLQQRNDYSSVEEMERFFAVEDLWKNFEENLGKLNYPNIVMEIARDYVPSPAEEHYEARLSDAQVEVETTIKEWRNYIQNGLAKWIKCVGRPDASKRLSLDPDAFYITFNYTKTLENLYSIAVQNILHIHGCIGGLPGQLVLGHGGAEDHSVSEIAYESKIIDGEVDDPSYDESYEMSKLFAFTEAEAIVKGWEKPVDAILKRNKHILAGLASVEEVMVLGLSFSDSDRRYFARFRAIIPNTAKWKVSWFGESDKRNIRSALRGIGIKYALIRMEDLQINQNAMEVDDL